MSEANIRLLLLAVIFVFLGGAASAATPSLVGDSNLAEPDKQRYSAQEASSVVKPPERQAPINALPPPLVVRSEESPKTLSLVKGQELMLFLPCNPEAGYTWEILRMPECLTPLGEPEYTRDRPHGRVTDAGGHFVWRFRAENAGRGDLRIAHMRSWDKEAALPWTVVFRIVVK